MNIFKEIGSLIHLSPSDKLVQDKINYLKERNKKDNGLERNININELEEFYKKVKKWQICKNKSISFLNEIVYNPFGHK
mgnify:CR=1 FL=1